MDRKSIGCSVRLQRRKGIGRILQETGKVLNGLDWDYRLAFVSDGSADDSLAILDSLARAVTAG